MKSVVIRAESLRVGDVIQGQRVNHAPVVHAGNVNVLLIKPSGYKMEHKAFAVGDKLVIKRPIHNMGEKAQRKHRKFLRFGRPRVVDNAIPSPTQTWDAMGVPTLIYDGAVDLPQQHGTFVLEG